MSKSLQEWLMPAHVSCLLVYKSSLFIGMGDGGIIRWEQPGVHHIFVGHRSKWIHCLLCHEDVLWSGSDEKVIKLWNITTRDCILEIETESTVRGLVFWRGSITSTSYGSRGSSNCFVHVWKVDGTPMDITWTINNSQTFAAIVWEDALCTGSNFDIILWKDWNKPSFTLSGHTDCVYCLATTPEYLFSGSHDHTIRRWNRDGTCKVVLRGHSAWVRCIFVHNGSLYSASEDKSARKWSLDGERLEVYREHTDWVQTVTVWRGAVLTGGNDHKIFQWTPFLIWNPSNHQKFPTAIKQGIKSMMMLAAKKAFPSDALPMDVLFIIYKLYATE